MKELEYKSRDIKIERFNSENDLAKMAELYAEVFAGPPWNEHVKCTGCKEFFGLENKQGDCCPNCSNNLASAYPTDETQKYIMDENQRNNAIMLTIKNGDELAGFAWGFTYSSSEEFAGEKYKTVLMQDKIKDLLKINGINGPFFYFSECGIRTDYRGKGLSNLLSGNIIKDAQQARFSIVMRTNCESPMVAVAQRFGMRQIMGPVVEIDGIRKTIIKTGNIASNVRDSENGNRVLFLIQ